MSPETPEPARQRQEGIEIRELSTHADFAEAVHLQRLIWGWQDVDLIPVRFFVVAAGIGGQALGAFDRASQGASDVGRLIGFCLAIPGVLRQHKPFLHSHMLGVLPEYRNSGAGWRLKMAQREDALERGFHLIEWTFDPLELKNAYFNIEKLGAIVRKYLPNQYGITSSALQAGMPTDRCLAEWHLDAGRVQSPHVHPSTVSPENGRSIAARIEIPAAISDIKRVDPKRAREIQSSVCEQFLKHFAEGLAVTGFERTEHAGAYLFSPWPVPR